MQYTPQLDDASKRVLRVIQNAGVAPGWQVMKEAPVTAEELANAAQALVGSGLIKASASLSNTAEIGKVYFNIQPSNSGLVNFVLSA
jgi:arsenate reductase-like glutaredoxin family protein